MPNYTSGQNQYQLFVHCNTHVNIDQALIPLKAF